MTVAELIAMASVTPGKATTPASIGADGVVRNYHRQRLELRTCELCRGTFWYVQANPLTSPGRFCSRRCAAQDVIRSGSMAGDRNPRWLGGVSNDNMRYRRRAKERWPEHERARVAVHHAIRRGDLTPEPCGECGEAKAEAHHDDYTRPLDVRWLCRRCHTAHHTAVKRRRRAA